MSDIKRDSINGQLVELYMGYNIYFVHISYNCPELVLYGYSTDRQLKNAIKKKLKKEGKL